MSAKRQSLSIIIPAYNEERHLRACLDAIAAQTELPDEVIVVDNNSTDSTAAIARSYAFVKVLKEKTQGIVYARNKGFDAATSDIIGRIDADTLLPSDWVASVKHFYTSSAHSKCTFSGGAFFYNLHTGNITGRLHEFLIYPINRIIVGYYLPWGSNMALPQNAWREVRSLVCLNDLSHEDLDLGIHLKKIGYKVKHCSAPRVSAKARRILDSRGSMWPYLKLWPDTLRYHYIRKWWLCLPIICGIWVGSYGLFLLEKAIDIFTPSPALRR